MVCVWDAFGKRLRCVWDDAFVMRLGCVWEAFGMSLGCVLDDSLFNLYSDPPILICCYSFIFQPSNSFNSILRYTYFYFSTYFIFQILNFRGLEGQGWRHQLPGSPGEPWSQYINRYTRILGPPKAGHENVIYDIYI